MGLECGWRHAQKWWSWEFEDFEKMAVGFRLLKDVVGYSTMKTRVGFSTVEDAVHFFGSQPAEMNWDLKYHKMHHAFGYGEHRLLRIVSLSSCHHGLKPETNKPFCIWNNRVHLYLCMYCITVVIDIIMAVVSLQNRSLTTGYSLVSYPGKPLWG